MVLLNHAIGFSRIGYKRDLKIFLEKCFNFNDKNFEINYSNLEELKKKIIYKNWKSCDLNNISYINLGDFSIYDHILDSIFIFNFIPERFLTYYKNNLTKNYFRAARGDEKNQPMEMVKWFNTNYHYIVPEYNITTKFSFNNLFLKKDIFYAKSFKKKTKFVIVGLFTLLKIGKIKDNKLKNKILLLPSFLENYIKLLNYLNKFDFIKLIQIDEPLLILNLSNFWLKIIKNTYFIICSYFSNIIFSIYFEKINKNFLNIIKRIPFYSIHLDLINGFSQKKYFLKNNFFIKNLSLGLIDGKNIWINNLEKSFYTVETFKDKKIYLSTNCSLMHVPVEKDYNDKFKNINLWISFGRQKLQELNCISKIFYNKSSKNIFFLDKFFIKNLFFIKNKKKSKLIFINKIQNKIRKMNINNFKNRTFNYLLRHDLQKKYFKFNLLNSTTIGSFPQTRKIRKIRLDYKNKVINKIKYENFIKKEINYIIKKQLDYNLEVLVHGEPERNDMVEYFAENLKGFLITNNGWVQSYGSRYVKPPVIYGDIYLEKYISINWAKYSQNLTKKPVKGMLTGPITILKWSFRRSDQPNYITSIQLSMAINKEIKKLENIGIKIIQIDEPAVREFLPIKKDDYKIYFNWVIKSFLPIYKNIKNNTQIHTHICYSNFKNIINFIKRMNIDVISLETSRSNYGILSKINKNKDFEVGPGIYDIHSDIVLDINKSIYLLKLIINSLDLEIIWVNPDCGLKTRKWKDINISLINMVYSCKRINKYIFN